MLDGAVRSDGMCMDIARSSAQGGVAMQLAACRDGWARQFRLDAAPTCESMSRHMRGSRTGIDVGQHRPPTRGPSRTRGEARPDPTVAAGYG